MTIVVCFPRPPFAQTQLESRAATLVDFCRAAGDIVDVVTLPSGEAGVGFDSAEALRWSLVDLHDVGGDRRVDAVVCLHPHTLFLRHPRKVAWFAAGEHPSQASAWIPGDIAIEDALPRVREATLG